LRITRQLFRFGVPAEAGRDTAPSQVVPDLANQPPRADAGRRWEELLVRR